MKEIVRHSVRQCFCALIAVLAGASFGGLRTTGLVEPTSVLKSAYLWLDAADDTTFTKNGSGGVTAWAGRSDSGIGATATTAKAGGADVTVYGTVGMTNGVPAYLMGAVGSGTDMAFTQTATLRTAFWAMDISRSKQAFFLGCRKIYVDYRRGGSGQYAYNADSIPFANGELRCDGVKVAQRTEYPPTGLHLYSYVAEENTHADRLSNDRNENGSNGGRALSELVLFNETLAAYDRLWVEGYLRVKWADATNVLSSAVTTGAAVYPNLVVDDAAAISIPVDPAPQDGTRPFVLVVGTLVKGTAAKVRLTVPATFFCTSSRVLLTCGAAAGITDVSDFEVTGPAGYSYSWTGTQLVATIALPPGAETKTLTADEVLEGPFVWAGTLDRGAANKVRVTMPRTLATYAGQSCTVLSCGASANIALDDFEIANLPVGSTLFWNGRVLTATYPRAIEPAFLKDDAHLWLDADDSDSFVWTDDRLGVTGWQGKGASGASAVAATAKVGGKDVTVYGTVGVTNGVSAYLMGEAGSGVDLAFPNTATLRSVFWAMDVSASPNAFFLGCRYDFYDYHRGDGGQYARFDGFGAGDLRCDGEAVSNPKTAYPPTGFHLYSYVASQDTHADRLSNDRNAAGRSGGRALSELILINRVLNESERQAVEKYLDLKWRAGASVIWTSETACGTGLNVDASVQLDEGAVLKFGALPAVGTTGLTVLGKFCRGTADKVRFAFPDGTAFDRPVTLLTCATSIGVTLDDFEVSGLDKSVVLSWDGRTLTASAGTRVLEPTTILKRAHLWLDAAAFETFTTNETGGVTAWAGRSDSGYGATASKAKVGTELVLVYGTVGVTNGVPAYLMGETGSGVDMSFERSITLRTAFWAMDISSNPDAFFLADSSHFQFHRRASGTYMGAYAAGNETGQYGWSKGTIFCDGANVGDPTTAIPPSGLHVYTGALSQDCSALRFANDRNQAGRSGGRALSEVALFNETLSDRERLMVENYLRVKWMGASAVLTTAVNAPSAEAVFPSLDLAEGASFTLTNAVDAASAAITVAGVLTKSASGKIVIDANGQTVAEGATILECASSVSVFLSDFDLTSFGKRKFSWDGQALKTVPAKGLLLILR